MSKTITITSNSISEQLNEWQLRNYDPRDSSGINVTSFTGLMSARSNVRDDPNWDGFVESIEEYRHHVDSLEKVSE